jgi:hypothetical protein
MEHGKNRWASIGVRLYYLIGLLYYVYAWFIVAGGVGVVTSLIGIYFSRADFWWIVAGAAALGLLIAGLSISFSNWRKRYRGINPGLKIMKSRTVYTVLPHGQYRYWRELDLVASLDGVDHFTHVFGWTGQGDIHPSAANGSHPELADDPLSTKKRLRIYFDRPRAKRDQFRIQYQLDMRDLNACARPFLRTTMIEKIRLLESEVVFETEDCPEKYKRTIYMSDVAEIPVKEDEVLVTRGENSLTWTVKRPRLGYNYCISW